jgi:hypothetical protein
MRLPKRIKEFIEKKQEFIDKNRSKMERYVVKGQNSFIDDLLGEVFVDFDTKDGKLLDTNHNYRMLAEVDKLYNQFNSIFTAGLSSDIISTTNGLVNLGRGYFGVALVDNLPQRFDKVVDATSAKIDLRLGIKGGNIVRGGFLESLFKDNTMATQTKNYISKSIAAQIDTKDFVKGLIKTVKGDEGPGVLEKQYQRYAYDLYQQYDRAYNSALAEEFDMNYFVYQGGLIDDSRDFCAAHNNKVWHRDEAADWDTWKPYLGDYPEGYTIKQKNIYDIPSYLGYPGYQPLIDAGGYNCRHSISWIPDELAFDLRPELKGTQ